MSGDYLIVGAPGPDPDSSISSSTPRDAVTYIYSRSGGKYQQSAMISAGTYSSALQDGDNLAISGETVVVGAPREYIYAERTAREYLSAKDGYRDAVYVNTHTPGTTSWPMQAVLRDPNPARNLYFGVSVAIDGDTIVVGAYEASTVAGGGYAHVFRLVYGTWIHETKLNEPTAIEFGRAVAISGETIVVSAPSTSEDIGCAFVYKRVGSDWSRQGTLSGEDELGDFGHSVAISGDTIIVGAPRLSVGAAFIFELTHGSWHKTNSLRPDGADGYVSFGTRVGIDGDIAVISAPGTPSPTGVKCTGKVYMYRMTGSSWAMGAELVDQSSKTYDTLGEAVCVHQDTIVASASYDYVHGTRTGSMSLFTSECPIVKGSYMKPFVECDIPADPGYYVPDDGQLWSTQLPCNGGKWQNLGGQTTCNECPDGTVTPTPGAFTSERSCKAPFPGSVTLGRTTALTTFAAPVSATMDGAPCRVVPGTKVGERSLIVPVVDAMNPGTHTVNAIFNTDLNIQETVDIVIPSDASYPALTGALDGTKATFLAKYPVCTNSMSISGHDAALVDVARDGDMPVCVHRANMTVDEIIHDFSPAISTSRPEGMACVEYANNAEFGTIDGIAMYVNATQRLPSTYIIWDGRVCAPLYASESIYADAFDEDVVVASWNVSASLNGETIASGLVEKTKSQFSLALFVATVKMWITVAFIVAIIIIVVPALSCSLTLLIAVLFVASLPAISTLFLVKMRKSTTAFGDKEMMPLVLDQPNSDDQPQHQPSNNL